MLYMGDVDDKARARLTTLLIDLRAEENISPIVTQQLIRQAQNAAGLSDKARMDRLLRHYVKGQSTWALRWSVGGESELHSVNWSLDRSPNACEALAWSESLEWAEVQTLTRALSQYGLIELDETGDSPIGVVATVAGRERVASVSQENPQRRGQSDSNLSYLRRSIRPNQTRGKAVTGNLTPALSTSSSATRRKFPAVTSSSTTMSTSGVKPWSSRGRSVE